MRLIAKCDCGGEDFDLIGLKPNGEFDELVCKECGVVDGYGLVATNDVCDPNDMHSVTTPMEQKVRALRELIWGYDIPSPTVPEAKRQHEMIQVFLAFIDNTMLKEDK